MIHPSLKPRRPETSLIPSKLEDFSLFPRLI